VQVNGGMQPGNSGGPVVDNRGRVVGVAVSIIRNTQINFAIPGESVRALLHGRISAVSLGEAYKKGGKIAVPITVRTLDPLQGIREMAIDWWVGDPGKPRPPATKEPAQEQGDSSPRQSTAVAYQTHAATGKTELMLAELPPAGKVLWFQPRVVSGAGRARWLQGFSRVLDQPVEPIPARLALRHRTGHIPVRLESKSTLRIRGDDGEAHSFLANIVSNLDEEWQSAAPDGTSPVRVMIRKFEVGISLDGKAPGPSPRLKQVIQDVGRLGIDLVIDRRGNLIRSRSDLRAVPAGSRNVLENFGDQMRHSLSAVIVPLPGGELTPGQSWQAQRIVPVEALDSTKLVPLDMTYTYRGLRTQQGQDVAVIDLAGKVRGVEGRTVHLKGDARGSATLDVETGRVVHAKATIDVSLEMKFRDETVLATGKLEVGVTRGD
jgi:hypothetical protein